MNNKKIYKSIEYKSIDLFAGIGGIRLGFERAFMDRIKTVFVSEWDEKAQETYRTNFKDDFEIAGDITKISEAEIPEFDICLAGFPCQAFSMAGKHQGFDDNYKGQCRGTLFLDVARICDYHRPKVIFCENVKGLTIHDKGRTYRIIKKTFEDLGYKVFDKILNSKDFGVPQNRERIYLVAFREDIAPAEFLFPPPTDSSKILWNIREQEPVPAKYYISDTYMNTLLEHKKRHSAKGNGFGYEIRDWGDIAGAIVCGGMGRERNLVIDNRQKNLTPTTNIKGKITPYGIRKMTPREWARLQGYPDSFKLPLADTHSYKQLGNSVTVNVIEAIARKIKEVLDMSPEERLQSKTKISPQKGNKGEWGEPYAAIKILGDRKLYLADENDCVNLDEWMDILELIRHETKERIVKYKCREEDTIIDIDVNNKHIASIPADEFLQAAETLSKEIRSAKGRSFTISQKIVDFLNRIELKHIKAKSIEKSDLFLSIKDPRAGVVRQHIGFSVKSEFGKDPTLFNTAKASAVVYKVNNMTDELMNTINSMVNSKGHAAVSERCKCLLQNNCRLKFVGFPYVKKAQCSAFAENLDLIDPRLPQVIENILWNYFFEQDTRKNLVDITERISEENPLGLQRPEIKYQYMIKSFLYASYCGMTASTLWDGKGQVNGGFIKVNKNGEVLAYYALESDLFKSYLFKNCYLELPSTDEKHGFYANIYKENDEYYFRLNFQIRYR